MEPTRDHPQRYALVNELHARPSPRLQVPSTTVFLAFKQPRDAANRDRADDHAHLVDLCRRNAAPLPDADAGHYAVSLGRHEMWWEGHTEFVTYAVSTPGLPERPFDPAVGEVFPEPWQRGAPGQRIAAVMIQVEELPDDPARILPRLNDWFVRDSMTASWAQDEAAIVAADFRVDAAGWMRFAVFVKPGVGPGRIGRLVQRLLELETYRAMSMLGLGRARHLTGQLNQLEPQLNSIVQGMNESRLPPEQALQELLDVSARLESASSEHAFRFGATRAYEAIVLDRVKALRETRFLGRQMLTEFMARRYHPAMRTAKSAEKRLAGMLDRTARAGDLLRTRVDVQRSAQNQDIMERMDRRADLQLRLQHTVEGLSVVAISYYAVGLLGHAVAPLAQRFGIDRGIIIAGMVPVVVLVVWMAMRRIRARLHDREGV